VTGDRNITNTSIATKTDSLQTVTADVNEVAYMVPINTATTHSSLNGKQRSELSLTASNTMGPVKWLLQNFETAQGVSITRTSVRIQLLRRGTATVRRITKDKSRLGTRLRNATSDISCLHQVEIDPYRQAMISTAGPNTNTRNTKPLKRRTLFPLEEYKQTVKKKIT
jgi:hypothetical protein